MGSPSDRDRCGLGSFIPSACRGRAEAFARRLHSRLTSLGHDGTSNQNISDAAVTEASWLGARAPPDGCVRQSLAPIALTQPRLSDAEQYLDFGLLESPPTEECDEPDFYRMVNKDNLHECHLNKSKETTNRLTNGICHYPSNDSDSDVYYDTEDLLEDRLHNGGETTSDSSSICSKSTSSSTQDFATTSDFPPSLNDDPPSLNGYLPLTNESTPLVPAKQTEKTQTNGYLHTETDNKHHLSNGSLGTHHLLETNHSLEPIKEANSVDNLNGCLVTPVVVTNGHMECMEEEEECETCHGHSSERLRNGDIEIYVSNLSINKDLEVECELTKDEEDCVIQNGVAENGVTNGLHSETPPQLEKEEEEEDQEERIPRIRRCSSLKTGKTPPSTPGRKKIVRFADVLGLDLADVRTFLDEVPKVPTSAYDDLRGVDVLDSGPTTPPSGVYHAPRPEKILVPLFQQPGGMPNFLDFVREQQVCLENAAVVDPVLFTIKGTVRVRNLDFHKSVHVRYTLDEWRTFADVQATYVDGSCDGFSDKFVFTVYAHTLGVGQKIELAVRFSCKGCQYWDSNKGSNYCFQCLPQSSSPSYPPIVSGRGIDDHWGADFY